MKRVKTVKQVGVRQSLLMAGLILASVSAQASVTLTASSGVGVIEGLVVRDTPGVALKPRVVLEPRNANAVIQPGLIQSPAVFLNTPSASSNVGGSMYYYGSTGYGSFSENDSSYDGTKVELELNRKGFGYRAEASAEAGLAKARAETRWVADNYGNSSASASSTWSDWFVISGGSGLGTANFESALNGVLNSAKNGSSSYSLNIGYSTGAYCYYWYNTCSEADQNQALFSQTSSLSGKGKSTLSQDIEGEFTFEYDKAFQLTAMLNVSASNGGMADFTLASLGSSLVLPEGSQLLSSSGLYVQAVPEAETYAMMLAGLGLVGWTAMRRRSRSK